MNVLVTGSSGLVGSALVSFLEASGHHITRLVRSQPRPGKTEVFWDPDARRLDSSALEGLDAVVHLAGENIAGRWTARKKARIRESRINGTYLLAESLAGLARPPAVLVAASAIGYYGDRGDTVLKEESSPGEGFLAGVCRDWEAAAKPAVQKGIRVVHLRIGLVLSRAGGALARMLPPFKLGLGGKIGSGKQYLSWIAIDDLVRVIAHVLGKEGLAPYRTGTGLAGAVNAVAPNPVTNLEFTRTLGRVLHRPTIFPMPAFAARLAIGEMGQELLLASQRVEPARLLASGYSFLFPVLEGALGHVLSAEG